MLYWLHYFLMKSVLGKGLWPIFVSHWLEVEVLNSPPHHDRSSLLWTSPEGELWGYQIHSSRKEDWVVCNSLLLRFFYDHWNIKDIFFSRLHGDPCDSPVIFQTDLKNQLKPFKNKKNEMPCFMNCRDKNHSKSNTKSTFIVYFSVSSLSLHAWPYSWLTQTLAAGIEGEWSRVGETGDGSVHCSYICFNSH